MINKYFVIHIADGKNIVLLEGGMADVTGQVSDLVQWPMPELCPRSRGIGFSTSYVEYTGKQIYISY